MLQHSVADALVRALRVVVLDILAKGPSEGRLAEEDHPGQALLLDRAYEPLGVGVAVRRARWSQDGLDFPHVRASRGTSA